MKQIFFVKWSNAVNGRIEKKVISDTYYVDLIVFLAWRCVMTFKKFVEPW